MNNDLQNTQTSMTVEEVRESLDSTDNGAVKNSIRNCLTVFQNDPKLEGAIRYNILTERIDIVKPLWWSKPTTTLNDTDLNYLMLYLEDQYTLTSEKKIEKAISIVADCNKYHPIRDYLNGLEWDGTERIRCALPHFLGAEESEFTYECLRLFMLGAISRVFKPGSKFETMLCLVGGQGAGKSTFFRLLAIKDEWFSDDLKRIDDDNVYRKMQGHWIIEMSEMIATANAKSIVAVIRRRSATAMSFFTLSSTVLPQTTSTWARRRYSRAMSMPSLCSCGISSRRNSGRNSVGQTGEKPAS